MSRADDLRAFNAASFAATFNQRLGTRSGREQNAPARGSLDKLVRGNASYLLTPPKTTGSSNSSGVSSKQVSTWTKLAAERTKTAKPDANYFYFKQKDKNGNFVKNVKVSKKDLTGFVGGSSHGVPTKILKTLSRPLDIISRPAYSVAEGLNRGVQTVAEGNYNPIQALANAGEGMIQGIEGKKKTGIGTVAHNFFDPNNKIPAWMKAGGISGLARQLDPTFTGVIKGEKSEIPNTLTKWTDRATGGVGDVLLDPTNLVTLGGVTALRKGGEDALKTAAREAAAKEVTQAAAKEASKQVMYDGVKQVIKNRVQAGFQKAVTDLNRPIKGKRLSVPGGVGVDGKKVGNRFVSAEQFINQSIGNEIDNIVREVGAGAQKGKRLYGSEMPKVVANRVAETYRKVQLSGLEKAQQKIIDHVSGIKKLSMKDIAKLRENHYVDEYFKAAEDAFSKYGAKADKNLLHDVGQKALMRSLDQESSSVYRHVLSEIGDLTYRAPTIRVAGKDVLTFRRAGRVLDKIHNAERLNPVRDLFSYSKHFPGYTSMVAQKVKSMGVDSYEQFHRDVVELAKGTTAHERRQIQEALLNGDKLVGRPEEVRRAIKDYYDQIYADEVQYGVRSAADPQIENYAYQYFNKPGAVAEKGRLKALAKEELRNTGTISPETLKKMDALNPEKDAIKALLYRKRKSVRDFTRYWLTDDLAGHYGVATTALSKEEALKRGLVALDGAELSNPLKASLKAGEKMYLPQQIAEVRNVFRKLSKLSGDEGTNALLRSIDYVTSHFKTLSTIYYPGYHVRNMVGDMFMGFLDGVRTSDYAEVLTKWKNRANKTLNVGGDQIPFQNVLDEYEKTSKAAGFYRTDIPSDFSVGRVQSKVQGWSENREDFGRFVHFYHALSEEYAVAKRELKDPAKAWEKAVVAARYRVNKYKFDFGAVTPFEQNVMKRAIPFYTYTRKAIPTLVEALALSPGKLSRTNRLLNSLNNSDNPNFNEFIVPQWIRDIGYSKVSDGNGEEPWILRHDILPTNLFNDYLGVGPGETAGQAISKNVLSRANPLIQTPIELATGKDLFSGKPVNSPADAILNKLRPVGTARTLTSPNKDTSEKLIQLLTGIPVQKVHLGSQPAQVEAVRNYNQKLSYAGYKIFLSGSRVALKDKKSNKVIRNFRTPEEAYQWYQQNLKAQKKPAKPKWKPPTN